MNFPTHFIQASYEFNTFERHVPSPCFRKVFDVEKIANAKLTIGVCGFYELYLNGERCTKGMLAPYISNPDHMVYYDCYDLSLKKGKNVLAIQLGNGFKNNIGGYIWEFDKASFRGAPCFALELLYDCGSGVQKIISDKSFVTADSPIIFDDYRFGEHYNALLEKAGWTEIEYNDVNWSNALIASTPKGEKRICSAEPIVVEREIKPIQIIPEIDGYRYDFGENIAGVCRLTINGDSGQRIEMIHGEVLIDDVLDIKNIWFVNDNWERDKDLVHRDIYVCSGKGKEVYTPKFTYHGFRYVLVKGITEEQATKDLLTGLVIHSDLEERGDFSCSDEMVNTLQKLTRRSSLSNFHYFPTDCPHREKNGWTADIALSCEHMLLNLNPEKSYSEWLRNFVKTQNEHGAFPGIAPTDYWGYGWGNGPAWDCALVYLPYYVYIYRGDLSMAEETIPAILKYLSYLKSRTDENGLIHIGLGDWCHAGRGAEDFVAPLELTDTIISMDVALKSAFLLKQLGKLEESEISEALALSLKASIRRNLIDFTTMTALGNCQTSQAMALYYDVFEEEERTVAFEKLLELINASNGHIDTGVLGGRVIFHVLSNFGYSDLALNMIVRPDFPSYGNWVIRGATTLWEEFQPEGGTVSSQNHHFWGDISSWFIKVLGGIRLNPSLNNVDEVIIKPSFVRMLNNVSTFHIAPAGRIEVKWERKEENMLLNIAVPDSMVGKIQLEDGWCFENGATEKALSSGMYEIFEKVI